MNTNFANSCEACINQRQNFYTTLRNKFTIVTEQTQLVDIMKSTEHGIILSLSKYISSCFMERNRCHVSHEIGIAVNQNADMVQTTFSALCKSNPRFI
jgi:hypothetical protein